jgi:hypothetical protein
MLKPVVLVFHLPRCSVLEIWGTEMVTVTPDTEGVALLRIENEKT